MAIAPLQLPGPLVVPQVDWSGLNTIGDTIMRRNEREREAQAFGGLVDAIPTRGEMPAGVTPGQPAMTPGKLPRGLRNNNPGNLEDGPLAKSLPGYKGPSPDDPRYATFDTPENGLGAMDALLTSYGRRGLKTYAEVTGRWAPKNPKDPNNDPEAYARFVSPNGDPNAPVDLSDPAQRKRLVGKMAMYENGMYAGAPREGESVPIAQPTPADVAAAARGMPADMKKKVQALFNVGSPAAREAAMGLISRHLGKQEPIKMGAEDILVDPNTYKTVAQGPGKTQRGEEPQLKEIELPDGTKVPVIFNPKTQAVRAVTPEELKMIQQGGDLPPEVSPKVVKKERSEALVANEQSAVASAKAAADLKPLIDKAATAYERATKAGAIGPIVGSPANRMAARYIYGGDAENARQEYEKALAAVQARITAAQNKGQGAVSDYERKMYAMQFPDLQASSPDEQVAFLKQLQESTDQTIAAGGSTMLGKQKSVPLERPAVQGSIPDGAVKQLRADPSPAARKEFDAIFGAGAAAKVLGGK